MISIGQYKTIQNLDAHIMRLRQTCFTDTDGNICPAQWVYWGNVKASEKLLVMQIWNTDGVSFTNPMNNLIVPQETESSA